MLEKLKNNDEKMEFFEEIVCDEEQMKMIGSKKK